jgi:hypothetical protein
MIHRRAGSLEALDVGMGWLIRLWETEREG